MDFSLATVKRDRKGRLLLGYNRDVPIQTCTECALEKIISPKCDACTTVLNVRTALGTYTASNNSEVYHQDKGTLILQNNSLDKDRNAL